MQKFCIFLFAALCAPAAFAQSASVVITKTELLPNNQIAIEAEVEATAAFTNSLVLDIVLQNPSAVQSLAAEYKDGCFGLSQDISFTSSLTANGLQLVLSRTETGNIACSVAKLTAIIEDNIHGRGGSRDAGVDVILGATIKASNKAAIVFTNQKLQLTNVQQNDLLQVVDVNGRVVLSQTLTNTNATIDCSSFAAGVYVVRVGEAVQRIVVR